MSETSQTITTVVTVSTVYPGPGGGAIFTAQDTSDGWLKAKAGYDCMPLAPVKGQMWELTGEFKYDKFYGPQLHIQSCRQIEPTGKLLYSYLRHHPAFRGIGLGDTKIAKLYHRFGDELRELLEKGDSVSLSEVLSEAIAERLVAAWHANAQESSVIAFLSQYRIDVRLAHNILRYWGAEAVEKLRENPYRLLILTSWDSADRVARNIGIEPLDPLRLVAATEAYVYTRLYKRKDTLTDESNLRNGIQRLIGKVDNEVAGKAVEFALQEKAIVGNPISGYQPVGCALMEAQITDRFKAMLPDSSWGQMDLFGSSKCNTLVDSQISIFEQSENLCLNSEQRRAIHMAATSSLSVLKGGAGVGKTTVLKAIYQVILAMNGTVFQMALAGRAAQRMREATGQEAFTIVGFLNRLKHGKISPYSGDLIVIDESSMLDLLLTYRLIKALPKGVRLLFVGDPYQLPPIGPGLIFHVLVNSPAVPSTELIEVHRQAESTGIPQVALQVRQGTVPDFAKYEGLGYGVNFIECRRRSIVNHLIDVVHDLGGFHETQILGVIKSGSAGVGNINTVFHQLMTPTKPRLHGWGLAESDPVIYTINDYEHELFNGSLGYIERVFPDASDEREAKRATVSFNGRTLDLSEEDLGNVELAYAITVHKAQGSQFKRVVIPVTKSKLLDRTLIYTSLTRGIEQVIFVGDKREFCIAVQKPPSVNMRQVGFSI
jgi:exodeoxyribonuclease V alpha subunit